MKPFFNATLLFLLVQTFAFAGGEAPPEFLLEQAPETKCGDADPAARGALVDALQSKAVLNAINYEASKNEIAVDYLRTTDSACEEFRYLARSELAEFRGSQQRMGQVPAGYPESFVYEYFQLGDYYAVVVLQSSEEFQRQIDPSEPLTHSWPGRTGSVRIFGADLAQLAHVDLLGNRVD